MSRSNRMSSSTQPAPRWGGHSLDRRGRALVFEEAGYSLLGPLALNVAAPDEGNMHLLAEAATPDQQERNLRPLRRARSGPASR